MSTPLANSDNRLPLAEVRRLFLALGILIAFLGTVGFWPSYFGPLISNVVEVATIVHVHAAVYVGWLLLFILQCYLAVAGKIALHKKVGNFGIAWGCIVILVGLTTSYYQFKRILTEGGIETAQTVGVFPVIDMILFGLFFGLAVHFRKKPELHKRFMLVAATSILVASVARFVSFNNTALSHSIMVTLWISPLLIAMAYELYRRKSVHPIYVWGTAVIIVSSFRGPIRYTEGWQSFTHWVASFSS